MIRTFFRWLMILSLIGGMARAQVFIPPPSQVAVYSQNRQFRAVSDTRLGKVRVYAVHGQDALEIWHAYTAANPLGISDDGEYLVMGGGNYLPADFTRDTILLSIYRHGRLSRTIRLGDVIPDYSGLPHTWRGTYLWGTYQGFDQSGRYWLRTAVGRRYAVDPSTGRVTSESH